MGEILVTNVNETLQNVAFVTKTGYPLKDFHFIPVLVTAAQFCSVSLRLVTRTKKKRESLPQGHICQQRPVVCSDTSKL